MRSLKTPIKVGSYYIDCGLIPRVCIEVSNGIRRNQHNELSLYASDVAGRSLIDGTIGHCSLRYCDPQKVDKVIAERWAKTGPLNRAIKEDLKKFYAGQWGNGRKIWWNEEWNKGATVTI